MGLVMETESSSTRFCKRALRGRGSDGGGSTHISSQPRQNRASTLTRRGSDVWQIQQRLEERAYTLVVEVRDERFSDRAITLLLCHERLPCQLSRPRRLLRLTSPSVPVSNNVLIVSMTCDNSPMFAVVVAHSMTFANTDGLFASFCLRI